MLMKQILRAPISRRTWAGYVYTVVSFPLAVVGIAYVFASFFFGGLLAITLIGLPVIAVALFGARFFGTAYRRLARVFLKVEIDAPPPLRTPLGFFPRLGAALSDAAGWRAMVFLVLRFPLACAQSAFVAVGLVNGLLILTYPIWWSLADVSQVDRHGVQHHSAMQIGDFYVDTWPKALLFALGGLLPLMILPWIVRGLLWLDTMLMKGLLGPTATAARMASLTETRAHAVDDSAAKLRRIERDLHDGAQAQLVALAMQLGEAKENLDSPSGDIDLAETRALVDTAHRNAKQAINELRDLARGIHPPALDNGLADALGTLASRSRLPVSVSVDLPVRPSQAIETIGYFCVAELLTNAAKHSGATRAEVVAGTGASSDAGDTFLWIRVTDNGSGGARLGFDGGLAGLVDRVRTVDGRLVLDSPLGGPTMVTVELPLQA
jgi:signal transduction histidine kinase